VVSLPLVGTVRSSRNVHWTFLPEGADDAACGIVGALERLDAPSIHSNAIKKPYSAF